MTFPHTIHLGGTPEPVEARLCGSCGATLWTHDGDTGEWREWEDCGCRPAPAEHKPWCWIDSLFRYCNCGATELEERFWAKVDLAGPNGCWLWTAGHTSHGYGAFNYRVGTLWKQAYAHRLAYEAVIGPIPPGLQIDHLCRNRACVNPEHLEPVTRKTNLLRGASFSAVNARKTHCVRGHEFSASNTYMRRSGRRGCRSCRQNDSREGYARFKARSKALQDRLDVARDAAQDAVGGER